MYFFCGLLSGFTATVHAYGTGAVAAVCSDENFILLFSSHRFPGFPAAHLKKEEHNLGIGLTGWNCDRQCEVPEVLKILTLSYRMVLHRGKEGESCRITRAFQD